MSIKDQLKATEDVLRIPPARRGSSRTVNYDRVQAAWLAARVAQEEAAWIAARDKNRKDMARMLKVAKDIRGEGE